uniref:Maestro heat like repeat family member 1 n=1 Tax=Chelydra serpentina TaxID=8475 RepID=A0A8C3SH24_CHESE
MLCVSFSELAVTLMDATTDKDPLVQEQIYNALCYLGESEPEEILNSCDEYLRQHDKLAYPHRIVILKAMEAVVKNNIAYLDKSTAKIVIFLASNEMTKSKEIICDWQQAASNVLVAAGTRFINKVMEEVLTKFQPGILPHYFIMQTFANLSVSNVFGMVPFLNSILGTMLPMLGMAKQDNMKSVFCYALQHFSESIQEYLANLDKAPDPTVRKDTFSNEIFNAYDVLFHIWLQSREAKLRLAVVKALGPMSHLMPSEKLEEQLPKLVPGILALYKKHAEAFYVTKSLCQILEASVNVGSRTLDTQLDALLNTLHPQICAPVESSVPLSLKNHNEVLRCFTVLACTFPDRLLGFLLPKLENHNERIRVGTLIIMRDQLPPTRLPLWSLLLSLCSASLQVRRAVVQVISAMAHHGYLEQAGGEVMIEYIVHQCSLPPDTQPRKQTPEADDLTSDSVQNISINTLFLISTTVDRMDEVLWPYLLEFVTPIQFTGALTPLCRSLMHLATKKQEEGENAFLIHYDTHANLPSPCALMARLLTVSSQPYLGDGRGAAALRLLNVLHLNIHPKLGRLWKKKIPHLVEHLEGKKSLSPKEWEDELLLLLRETLTAISDSAWICQFSTEMCKQLNSYNGFPSEKNFLYKCIGTALGVCSNKDVVQKQLQELLETARYQEEEEREGLASSFGICAINHLDETLAKLEDFVKSDVFKKSVGLFSIFKDRSDNEAEKIKSTLILCYGYVARYAPKELVLSRIEADILRNIFHYFNTRDLTLKLCLIRSICMISQAICNSAQSDAFVFSRKAELLAQMMEFIKTEPLDLLRTPVRQRAMISCTYLVYPFPVLPPREIMRNHLPRQLELPLHVSGMKPLYHDTVSALKDLLKSLLQKELTPHGLQSMFEVSGTRAMPFINTRVFVSSLSSPAQTVVPFYNLGVLVALFSPRCSDSLASIRLRAVDCAYYLLYIQLCYEGFAHDYRDEMVERLKDLKKGLEDPDFTILFNTCYNIAMRLPPDQLMSLLLMMFEGLADPDQNCSRAAAVMINALLKERGGVLLDKVPVIVALIHSKLQEVDEEHVRKAAQQTVYILASQHKTAVVSSLLGSSLPFDSHTCAMWKALATEPTLTSQILELLLDKVNRDVPYKENKSFLSGSTCERIATPLPFAATCALHEIMSAPESGAAVLGLYPHLFVALLLRVSCTVGVQLPKNLQSKERKSASRSQVPRNLDPCSCAVEALRAMLTQGGSDEVVKSVGSAGGWELMKSSDQHHDGIALLASAMAKHAGPKLPLIVKNLFPMLNSVYDRQRITTTAFFAELLNSSVVSDLILLESMMDNMTGRQKDPCTLVRMLALRGLGNISSGSPDKVRKHGAQLLASMVNGMDDKDDPNNLVALEAMSSLSKLLDHVEERDIRSMLLHIAIRIRPFFDNENHELRTSSIVLFGNLTKFSAGNCEDVFFEQILNGLVTLLLHLQDPKPEVIKACKFALRMCGPNMGCEGLCDMFLNHLHEDRSLHYGEFMNHVCKHLMQNYPEMLNRLISTNLFYFKSNWIDIRAAAPMFIGKIALAPFPHRPYSRWLGPAEGFESHWGLGA